nr:hypothetical protein 12 [Legionellales bacterium]
MPAASETQQRLMGMVHAYQQGKLNLADLPNQELRDKIKSLAKSMKKKDAEEFASTKHKGIPAKVKKEQEEKIREYIRRIVVQSLEEQRVFGSQRTDPLVSTIQDLFSVRGYNNPITKDYLSKILRSPAWRRKIGSIEKFKEVWTSLEKSGQIVKKGGEWYWKS